MALSNTHPPPNFPSSKIIRAHFQLQRTVTAGASSANVLSANPKKYLLFEPWEYLRKNVHSKLQDPGVHRVGTETRGALQNYL